MENQRRFEDILPVLLRSIPYIAQSHVFKAYCALENLYAQKPHWPDSVWEHCTAVLQSDEPKVEGLLAPELLELEEIVDPTSGRDFGPDWILKQGLMPLSYWAIHKKTEEMGFPALFQHFLEKGLDHPRYLGHELSVLAGNWQFYEQVIGSGRHPDAMPLFLQRFTEFVVTTFHSGHDTTFDHPEIDTLPSESELVEEVLTNPAFFGHNVLAFVWCQRLRPLLSPEQREQALRNVTVMTRWHSFGDPPADLAPLDEDWSDEEVDRRFAHYFHEGPTNTHQITLADALLWVWNHYPQHRRRVAANIVCFSKGVSP